MKYEKEIDDMFRSIFYEDFLDEDEFNFLINEGLKQNNISKQVISDQLETGVNNGYSIEDQIMLVKMMFITIKNENK